MAATPTMRQQQAGVQCDGTDRMNCSAAPAQAQVLGRQQHPPHPLTPRAAALRWAGLAGCLVDFRPVCLAMDV